MTRSPRSTSIRIRSSRRSSSPSSRSPSVRHNGNRTTSRIESWRTTTTSVRTRNRQSKRHTELAKHHSASVEWCFVLANPRMKRRKNERSRRSSHDRRHQHVGRQGGRMAYHDADGGGLHRSLQALYFERPDCLDL